MIRVHANIAKHKISLSFFFPSSLFLSFKILWEHQPIPSHARWLTHWTPYIEAQVPPWLGHYYVFFGKALYSHSASLHSRVWMGIGKLLGKPDEILGGRWGRSGDLVMDSHPIQGRVWYCWWLHTKLHTNWDKFQLGATWLECRLHTREVTREHVYAFYYHAQNLLSYWFRCAL